MSAGREREYAVADLIVCAMPSCKAKRAMDADMLLEAAGLLEKEAEAIRMANKIAVNGGIKVGYLNTTDYLQYERVARNLRRMASDQT